MSSWITHRDGYLSVDDGAPGHHLKKLVAKGVKDRHDVMPFSEWNSVVQQILRSQFGCELLAAAQYCRRARCQLGFAVLESIVKFAVVSVATHSSVASGELALCAFSCSNSNARSRATSVPLVQ